MAEGGGRAERALGELVRVLEGAVGAGVQSVGLEYEGRELVVFFRAGNVGLGAGCIARELQQDVIGELITRAGPFRRDKGRMRVTLLGREYMVDVERYQTFGEWAYNLTLREPRKKAGG